MAVSGDFSIVPYLSNLYENHKIMGWEETILLKPKNDMFFLKVCLDAPYFVE